MRFPFIGRRANLADVNEVLVVKHRHEDRLMQSPYIVGVGIGNENQQYHIRLYVDDTVTKTKVPKVLDGVPVYIVHTTGMKAFG